MENLFVSLVALVCAGFAVHGYLSGGVVMRGGRKMFDSRWYTVRRRDEEPLWYWGGMTFYTAAAIGLFYMVLFR